MVRKKTTMAAMIRKYMKGHPNTSPREIAKALGVKITLVYSVRYHDAKKSKIIAAPKQEKVVATAAPVTDLVNTPPHYTAGGIETIDFLAAKLSRQEFIGYLKGNVLKYGSRLGKKGDMMLDAGKMAWYAAKLRDTLQAPV